MKHPTLKIVKTEAAQVFYGDYGASSPQVGDWSYRTPAVYVVTGPTGRMYTVTGSGASWMQQSVWHWERPTEQKGGFCTMADCLTAIGNRERATIAAQ